MKYKIINMLNIIIGSVLLIFGLIPLLLYNIYHIGVIFCIIIGFGMIFFTILHHTKKKLLYKKLLLLVDIVAVFSILFSSYISIYAHINVFKENKQPIIVILGCQIINGTPSLMLKNRLDNGYQELLNFPKADCIVSGGHTEGESMSEANVMFDYLTKQKHIYEKRIFLEDTSSNTKENLEFTAKLIKKNNLSKYIIISTDAFHQFRASLYAKEYGLIPYTSNCKSPWGLIPTYYAREMFAVLKAIIFDLK